jgi:hypothetical protein
MIDNPMIDNQDPRAVRTREKLICAFNEAVLDSDPGKMSVSTGVRCSAPRRAVHSQYCAGVVVWLRFPGVVQVQVPGQGVVRVQPGVCLVWWSWRQAGPRLHSQVRPPRS